MNKSTNKEKGTHFSKYSETKNAFILYQEDPVYVILREHLNIKPWELPLTDHGTGQDKHARF